MKIRVREFYKKHERHLSIAALVGGFVWDNLTLRRIDLWAENLVIFAYLLISCGSILFLNIYNNRKTSKQSVGLRGLVFDRLADFVPYILQFVFGGLFSVFVVFYSKSASVVASWPFILFLAVLLIGNEVFQKRYLRLIFQMTIFFVALFSYFIFLVPVVIGKMGAGAFLLSGFLSLVFIGFIVFVLHKLAPQKIKEHRRPLLCAIAAIYLLFNVFYFTNIIPPIPLSLKEAGVCHSVKRTDSKYVISYEPAPWYSFFDDFNSVFHRAPGESVYFYSAVFAPTKINTDILHRWSYFDEKNKEWIVLDNLKYSIVGGRDGGYRGYSLKNNVASGKWKVDVITEQGQVLGRVKFSVVDVASPSEPKTDLR